MAEIIYAGGAVVISSLATLAIMIFLGYDIYLFNCKVSNQEIKKKKLALISSYVLRFACFALLFHTVSSVLVNLVWLDPQSIFYNASFCKYVAVLSTVSYHVSRMALYLLLVSRLHMTFSKSEYEYSFRWVLLPLYVFISVAYSAGFVLDFMAVGAVFDEQSKIIACVITFPKWGVAIAFSLDIILSIISLVLFIRPLQQLRRKHLPDEENSTSNNKIDAIVVKYSLLVSICIISSMIMYLLVFTFGYIGMCFSLIDDALNVYCLLLLKIKHKKIYELCCAKCDDLCFMCYGFRSIYGDGGTEMPVLSVTLPSNSSHSSRFSPKNTNN